MSHILLHQPHTPIVLNKIYYNLKFCRISLPFAVSQIKSLFTYIPILSVHLIESPVVNYFRIFTAYLTALSSCT